MKPLQRKQLEQAQRKLNQKAKFEGKTVFRGWKPKTGRLLVREVNSIHRRSPAFWTTRQHIQAVKRIANVIARQIQEKMGKNAIDRGAVNLAALAHDAKRDAGMDRHDEAAAAFLIQHKAPGIARIVDKEWALEGKRPPSIEAQVLQYADFVSRSVEYQGRFVHGVVPLEQAYRIGVTRNMDNPHETDRITTLFLRMKNFEASARRKGVFLSEIVENAYRTNSARYREGVTKLIETDQTGNAKEVERLILESKKRVRTRKGN